MVGQFEPEPYRLTFGDRFRGLIWNITEPFRLDRTPAWASLFAIALVVAPGAIERLRHGRWGDYDPTIAVLTATLIAVIWEAHYTFRAVRHSRQLEQRESLRRALARQAMAVGIMAELDYLKLSLELLHGRIAVRGVHFLDRPQMRNALSRIDLFSTPAAADLSRFDSVLRQIESHCALYAADHAAGDEAAYAHGAGTAGIPVLKFDPTWVESIRKTIDSAQALIPHVHKRLLEECYAKTDT